ncbi:hypothetical protein Cylst_6189 [Cylindrospermum stagnale PCC 7417]|uniref:Uncharacterized protein n=1 Tax=Cylindrospermum stagnale PCC 7417 TaxID=56107 RepID=K9X668_9NOST|nr:hypothetical protein [Cylindrospermum stagnale]AFZ28155.1 hypothetical protein Cylst_6189 [Cylindrospermum stagnale PCC 7417]
MNSTELTLEQQVKIKILEMHVQGLYHFTKCLIQIKNLQQSQIACEPTTRELV